MNTLEQTVLVHLLPTWHQSGRHHHHSPGQITVSLEKAWKHSEDHVLWFPLYFHHHSACSFGGQAGAHRAGPTPHFLDPQITHQLVTARETPQLTLLAPFLFSLYIADFSHQSTHSHLQKFSDHSAQVLWSAGGTSYDSVVASVIFYGVVCCSSSISAADRQRLDKLNIKASSILGSPLYPLQVVGKSRMMDELSSLLVKESHPLQVTITALGSSFSNRLIHPKCEGEVSQVLPSCCCQSVQPALLPVDLTVHCAIQTIYTTNFLFLVCTI